MPLLEIASTKHSFEERKMKRQPRSLLFFALTALVWGCGGTTPNVTKQITAEKGGTLTIEGEETQIAIPPMALEENLEISLSIVPLSQYAALKDALDRVLKIEPAGTTLKQPASVRFDPASVTISPTDHVSVAQFRDGVWKETEIKASVVSGGSVGFQTSWLGPTVMVVRKAPSGPTGGVEVMVYDRYEKPLANASVLLLAAGQTIDKSVTASDGKVVFNKVAVGSCSVRLDVEKNCMPNEKEITVKENLVEKVSLMLSPPPCQPN
jgi:hypothetical protein